MELTSNWKKVSKSLESSYFCLQGVDIEMLFLWYDYSCDQKIYINKINLGVQNLRQSLKIQSNFKQSNSDKLYFR